MPRTRPPSSGRRTPTPRRGPRRSPTARPDVRSSRWSAGQSSGPSASPSPPASSSPAAAPKPSSPPPSPSSPTPASSSTSAAAPALSAASLAVLLPEAEVHGVDIDEAALECARRTGGFHVHHGSWWDGLPAELKGRVDLAVAYLPHVPTPRLSEIHADFRSNEPSLSVDGGPDGLDPLRAVLADADTGSPPAVRSSRCWHASKPRPPTSRCWPPTRTTSWSPIAPHQATAARSSFGG